MKRLFHIINLHSTTKIPSVINMCGLRLAERKSKMNVDLLPKCLESLKFNANSSASPSPADENNNTIKAVSTRPKRAATKTPMRRVTDQMINEFEEARTVKKIIKIIPKYTGVVKTLLDKYIKMRCWTHPLSMIDTNWVKNMLKMVLVFRPEIYPDDEAEKIASLAREAHEVDVGYEWMQVLNEKQLAAILKICEEALEFSNVGETKSARFKRVWGYNTGIMKVLPEWWSSTHIKQEKGDYCYVIPARMVNTHGDYVTAFTERGCLRGNLLADLSNTCWQDNMFVYCICDHDYCDYGFMRKGNLNCSEDSTKDSHKRHYRNALRASKRLMRPQSCIRIEMSKYGSDVKCLCDTVDHCDTKLISEQVLDTGLVNCSMRTIYSEEDLTCTGQFCFITSESEKGCITNNEKLYAGLYRPGTFTFDGIEYVICNNGNCNQNFEEAIQYAAAAAVYAPSPILSLTSATQALSISLSLLSIYFCIAA
ncbi:hypothetical protein PRIPAC_86602 [Pristionchus pacificus]|uniref:DUF7622 domain-containing protein n=1 Tax=Pristionchus pacificus TaxID=54126 RepID=A0A2A6BSQ5_PRIPA|nr:hypothetical protein PRIPAC_86602 [Pristionchus pacificus]|eukprot:PDM68918.1 hypothetical protein PRIPAC_47220 [Pristionchus pacificus]